MRGQWPRRARWLRLFEIGLAVVFIVAGTVKLMGHPFMVEIFTAVGAGQWLRYLTGSVELAGGLLLLRSRYSCAAALALGAIMVGAAAASVVALDRSPVPPLMTLAALLAVAWERRPSVARDRAR
jgi:putative oxidoreductase